MEQVRVEALSKAILALDISSGSDLGAVALSDLRVRIWNLGSGQVVHELFFAEPQTDERLKLEGEAEPICVRFSPDGRTLAVSFLSQIHLFSAQSWQEELTLRVAGEDDARKDLQIISATPQLKQRSADDAQVEKAKPVPDINQNMRNIASQWVRGDGRTRVTDFSFIADASSLLVAYCRGGCYAWPGHRWQAFPTGNDPVRLWSLGSKQVVWERKYDAKGVISRVVPSPDGKRFAAVNAELGRCSVGVYDLSNGHSLFSLSPVGACPPSLGFLPDGISFFTAYAGDSPAKNRKDRPWEHLALYKVEDGERVEELSAKERVRIASLSSDGVWLVSTSWWGRQFQIWDMRQKKPIVTQYPSVWKRKGPPIDRVAFSPDEKWLIVGNDEAGQLVVYRLTVDD